MCLRKLPKKKQQIFWNHPVDAVPHPKPAWIDEQHWRKITLLRHL